MSTMKYLYTTLPLALLYLLVLTSAQDTITTVSLFLPSFDTQSLVASIISADTTTTTYAVICANLSNKDKCGMPTSITIVEGSSTFAMAYTGSNDLVGLYGYDMTATTEAICSVSIASAYLSEWTGEDGSTTPVSKTTLRAGDFTYMPVVVTAGLEKLGAQEGTTPTAGPFATSTGVNVLGMAMPAPTSTGAWGEEDSVSSTGASGSDKVAPSALASQTAAASQNGVGLGVGLVGAMAAFLG